MKILKIGNVGLIKNTDFENLTNVLKQNNCQIDISNIALGDYVLLPQQNSKFNYATENNFDADNKFDIDNNLVENNLQNKQEKNKNNTIGNKEYIVLPGENIEIISKKLGVEKQQLVLKNKCSKFFIGQKLLY